MENHQMQLNSCINTTESGKSKERFFSQKYKGSMNMDIYSKKIGQVSNSSGKLTNSNRIHLNSENVRVIVRVRPIQEGSESSSSCVSIINENKTQEKQIVLEDPRHRGLPKKYKFDEIYGTESNTDEIYSKEIKDYVDPLLSECSCINIFAFGSSGTGKTFTMHGDLCGEIGIVGLTIKQLIETNSKQAQPGRFSFSFFEVYCEKIQDLLTSLEHTEGLNKHIKTEKSNVSIRTDICGRIRVVGTNISEFKTWDEFNSVYTSALKKRASGRTAVNSNSSRSHACIQVNYIPPTSGISQNEAQVGNEDTIENRRRRGSISFHVKPKVSLDYPRTIVNLIDLSGFENNKITNNTGIRMAESTFINSSLLSLSKVINALKRNAGTNSTQNCIPYRESKLTRLLQEYLGGGADPPYSPYCLRCIMICTISPSVTFFQQTYATLNTPSYGNNSIMKRCVGIASTVGRDSRNNSDTNKKGLVGQRNDLNTSLNKSASKRSDLNSKSINRASAAVIEKKLLERTDNEILSRENLYRDVQSRVGQMIRGKLPLNMSKTSRSRTFNSQDIAKGKGSPSINSHINKAKQPNSIGSIDDRRLNTKGSEALIPCESKPSQINCNSVLTEEEAGKCTSEKKERLNTDQELQESRNKLKSSLSNGENWYSVNTHENKSINTNVDISDNKDEFIDLGLNKDYPSSSIRDKEITEVRKVNRPVTRSQTRKIS